MPSDRLEYLNKAQERYDDLARWRERTFEQLRSCDEEHDRRVREAESKLPPSPEGGME